MSRERKLLCAECNRKKGIHLFYKRSSSKRGYSLKCKSCVKKSPQYKALLDKAYRRKYGISLLEYEVLLLRQNDRCAICRRKPGVRRLAVDHDHNSEHLGIRKSVRGLLCRDCNEYIGRTGDDPEVGLNMERYLHRGPGRFQ
jgi:hypothetical protein